MNQITGSCKCGEIGFNVDGPALQIVTCHCGMCRSLTGAAFSTYVVVREEHFTVTAGLEKLANYEVTDKTRRYFCRACGTSLFNSNPETYKGLKMLYFGTVRGNEHLEPRINIFCESKLPWVTLNESSKSFHRAPSGEA